jgi:tryptophan synthase alpha chain
MKAHERISKALGAANDAGRPALIPFITAGYPEPADFITTLKAVAEVGDVVEVGIPFSDPMADGMTIQRSSFEALQKGVSLKWIFDQLDSVQGEIDAPMVMMSYLNPLLAFGYDALAERALAAGVCGFIVPDLPFEESDEIREALEVKGLGLIQLVTPATPDARLKMLCDASRGFVYAVTITGITGGGTGLPADLAGYLDKVAKVSALPVCAGFGIREAGDVAAVGKHAAGAIVGSALVEVLERGEDPQPFLQSLRGA